MLNYELNAVFYSERIPKNLKTTSSETLSTAANSTRRLTSAARRFGSGIQLQGCYHLL